MTEYSPPPASGPTVPAVPPPLPSTERSPWNGWWTLLWAVVVVTIWQFAQTIGMLAYLALEWDSNLLTEIKKDPMVLMEKGDAIWMGAFVGTLVACPACWAIGWLRPGWSGWEYLGTTRVKWQQVLLWLLAIVFLVLGFNLIAPYIGVDESPEVMIDLARNTNHLWLMVIGVAIGAPLVEEFMFRGVLFRGWRNSRLGFWGTTLLTSLLWAAMHIQYDVSIISLIFVMGILLAFAREKTGNIWVPVGMHALNNSMAAIEMIRLL